MSAEAELMPVAEIVVGNRVRKVLNHQGYLTESIRTLGLLQPILVNGRKELVAGFRRLQAVKSLGWSEVPVRKIETLNDALSALLAERAENTCREQFTVSELVEIGRMIEELERPKAAAREKAGTKAASEPSGNFPEGSNGDTRDKVAKALGVSGKTYEKAKKVVEAAEANPEMYQDIAEKMETTGKVDPAYKEMTSRKGEPTQPKKKHSSNAPPHLGGKSRRVGVEKAQQAIDILNTIRKDDLLRDRAVEIVSQWLNLNWAGDTGRDKAPSFYTEVSRIAGLVGEIPDTRKHGAYWESIKPWDVVESLEEAARVMLGKARSLRRAFHI